MLNVSGKATAALIVPANGDHVAVIGQNRKLLVFPASQLNEMARGKGTRLQRYKDGRRLRREESSRSPTV